MINFYQIARIPTSIVESIRIKIKNLLDMLPVSCYTDIALRRDTEAVITERS